MDIGLIVGGIVSLFQATKHKDEKGLYTAKGQQFFMWGMIGLIAGVAWFGIGFYYSFTASQKAAQEQARQEQYDQCVQRAQSVSIYTDPTLFCSK